MNLSKLAPDGAGISTDCSGFENDGNEPGPKSQKGKFGEEGSLDRKIVGEEMPFCEKGDLRVAQCFQHFFPSRYFFWRRVGQVKGEFRLSDVKKLTSIPS